MFRDISKNPQTALEKEVKEIMTRGDLIPDDVTIGLVEERIKRPDCEKGFILDGFPRTVPQAEVLDKMLENVHKPLDYVFLFEVDDEALVERKAGRLFAPQSKRVYHKTYNPPKEPGKCDETGENLIQRDDDKPEATRHRLSVYQKQTAPVIAYYDETKRITRLDGMGSMDEVFTSLCEEIDK